MHAVSRHTAAVTAQTGMYVSPRRVVDIRFVPRFFGAFCEFSRKRILRPVSVRAARDHQYLHSHPPFLIIAPPLCHVQYLYFIRKYALQA